MGYNIEQYGMGDPYSNGSNWSNANGYNKADSFFNAIGDVADLTNKISSYISNRASLQEALRVANAQYNSANNRNPCNTCYAMKKQKEADKQKWAAEINTANSNISINESLIAKYQKELADRKALDLKDAESAAKIENEKKAELARIEKEKKEADAKIENEKKEADAKTASRDILAKQGLTPEAVEAKLLAEGKTASKTKTFLIGGVVLLIGIFGVIILKRRN